METITPSRPLTSNHRDRGRKRAAGGDGAVDAGRDARPRRSVVRRVAIVTAVLALSIVVVGGSWGWMVARLAMIGLVGWGVLRLDGRCPPISAFVGALLAATGVGLLPHLVGSGPTLTGPAAIALIGSGLTLLVLGTVDQVRHRRWWRQVLGVLTAIAVLGVTTAVVTPAVAATNVPRPELGATPDERGLRAESVRLRTAEGVELAAWYVPSRNGAAVVLRHGAGSTRSDVLDQAVVLARHGYGVLMTDAQGHGESDGRAMDFGWNGDAEVTAAVDFLQTEEGIQRLGLVGMSMGGEEVLGAAGSQPQVRAVIAEGATARRAVDKDWLSDVYGLRGIVQEQFERAQERVTDLLTEAAPPVGLRDAVRRTDAEVLLITAGAVPDETHAAGHIASGAPGRVEIWTVEDAGHTGGLVTDPDGWEQRVISFLDANL